MSKKQPKKKLNGYKMPEPLPKGLILGSIDKKKWKLGTSIGKGGFGEIYTAQDCSSGGSSTSYPYVIKIEPHENGPLFVEMHTYIRIAKSADVEAYKNDKKLTSLGMPQFIASGSQEHNNQKYRFLVMEKFGSDIWKLFLENNRKFPPATVFQIGLQILDVLEYIHTKGYIHGDIKGANILLGLGKEATKQVYLVDFGLCAHYDSKYKPPDPKKAHNGTIEYLSRDAHMGVQSRRGDLEILGYNLIQWLGCVLPWEKDIADAVTVQKSKEKSLSSLSTFLKTSFGKNILPSEAKDTVEKYLTYVVKLEFETTPDYQKLRQILTNGITKTGSTVKSAFNFKSIAPSPKRKQSPSPVKLAKKSKKNVIDDSETEDIEEKVKTTRGKKKTKNTDADMQNASKDDSTAGFTAEMLRVRERLKEKKTQSKTKKSTPKRPLRERKVVNYSPDIISDSE